MNADSDAIIYVRMLSYSLAFKSCGSTAVVLHVNILFTKCNTCCLYYNYISLIMCLTIILTIVSDSDYVYDYKSDYINSDYVQVQTLLAACQRFVMVRISDSGPNWK